jgi:uncharacterized protein
MDDRTAGVEPPNATEPSGPVPESARFLSLDTTRAIALLGIFFVNASLFALPFASLFELHSPNEEGFLSVAVFWGTAVFCNGKFYPLFSLMFGVGLAIMHRSALQRGNSFGWTFFRRIAALGLFGLLHIIFLWWGDVLLVYAGVGISMLFLGRLKPNALLWVGGVAFGIGQLLAFAFISLTMSQMGAAPKKEGVEKPMPVAETSLAQIGAVLKDWNTEQQFDSRLTRLESDSFKHGPIAAAVAMRVLLYLFCVPFLLTMFIWVVFPCFCLGAALLKLGFFEGQLIDWRRRFIGLGLFVGLPLCIVAAIGSVRHGPGIWGWVSPLALNLGGPLMSLMYLSFVLNWIDSGRVMGLARLLANLGRMGLTGYLLESMLMSAAMMHWGLGRFGETTWAERALWVIGIYLVILILANFWMTRFRFGPLEWLWRSFTYWRWQPWRRSG